MQTSDPFQAVSAVVAIPVRDEAERIADCLVALSRQVGGAPGAAPGVVLLVNNTTDRTVEVVSEVRAGLGMPVVVEEREFPPGLANAGQARKAAMEAADRLAPPGAPLLCTDADGLVAPDWLEANLRHLNRGIEAVFGRAEIDAEEAAHIPPALHAADAAECAYARLLDEIEHLIDPDPDDPWPRHTEHSGASIAVSRAAYARAGGIPAVALGEDRAFAAALRRVDARVRHAPEVRVVVSGRILGRAVGGMADTIRRRLVAPDVMLDDALEPVAAWVARVKLRRAVRAGFSAWQQGDHARLREVLQAASLDAGRAEALAGCRWFGEVWAEVDPLVLRSRVRIEDVAAQTLEAERIRDWLQIGVRDVVAA